MRFSVHVAHPDTGAEHDFEVEAATIQEAEQRARDAGFLVGKVVPLSDSPPATPQRPAKPPKKKTPLFGGVVGVLLVVAGIVVVSAMLNDASDTTTPRPRPRTASPVEKRTAHTEAKVKVIVNDDTDRYPLPEQSELWVRGTGSWWLARHVRGGVGGDTFGPFPIGIRQTMSLYPDDRDGGVKIEIPFTMTREMNPKGAPGHAIYITISDTEVTVLGKPIEAAGGKVELVFPRR